MKKIILLLLILTSPLLKAEEFYLGADIQHRHMVFNFDNFGEAYHAAPQANIFAGYRMNQYFALEGGFHRSKTKGFAMTSTRTHIRGSYITLLAHRPILDFTFLIGGGVSNLFSVYKNPVVRKYHYKKTVPRYIFGLQFEPSEETSMRFTINFERVSRLRHNHSCIDVSPQQAFTFGTGLLYKFY